MNSRHANGLPVLDLGVAADLDRAEQFRADLRDATHHAGFFYLVGHGVPEDLTHRLLEVAGAFFALPEAEKLAIENLNSPHFRGYTRLGGERTLGRQDWREQIDIGPEKPPRDDGADWDILRGPNQWPAALPQLREVITEWDTALARVARRLLAEWALSLGQQPDVFDSAFADPQTLIKIVRYPPVPADVAHDQGVGAHKDSGVLTLLLVEPGKAGLQVQYDDGTWVDVPPVDGAFIVNIGELLEVATQGYLRATVHRVVTPRGSEARMSIPYFFNPSLAARIRRLTLPAQLAASARGITDDPDNVLADTYGENALKSRLRAHPDVAQKFHSDLVARRATAG